MNSPTGSLWAKWDLHVHTPASIFHNYPGSQEEAWDLFLSDLENLPQEFKVIGINDYLFLDGYKRVLDEKNKGRLKNIELILPVIELRLDKFGGHDSDFRRVNFHVIFDNSIDPEIIETQFLSLLPRDYKLLPGHEGLENNWSAVPTRQALTDFGKLIIKAAPEERKAQYDNPLIEGFNNFNVTLDNVKDALSSTYFKDKCLTAVGKTEWEAIKWGKASIAEKRNIITTADIVFTAAETIEKFQNAQSSLSEAKVNDKLIDCSDAHWLSDAENKDRIGNCFTWFKADTTFTGLQHAIKEYTKRVFVGEAPNKKVKVQTNPTKYIKKIEIKKVANSDLTEPWFNCAIPMNTDLVAIIGNKGNGKSALADVIGLLGNSQQAKHFSFLNDRKFQDPRGNKALHFEATLTWRSGNSSINSLNGTPDHNAVETVKYLPQNYIETLCNEIVIGTDSGFDRELKQIIFSHVEQSERLGHDTLDSLIEYLTSETQEQIRVLVDKVHSINQKIVQYEKYNTEDYHAKVDAILRQKKEELDAHEQSKPNEVPEPTQSEKLREAAKQIRSKIEGKENELDNITSQIDKLNKTKIELTRKVAILNKATTKLSNFSSQYKEFKSSLAELLNELEIDSLNIDEIVNLTINSEKLSWHRTQFENEIKGIDVQLNLDNKDGLVFRKRELVSEVKKLQNSLDEPNRKFVAYQTTLSNWNKQRDVIVGDSDTRGSLEWLKNWKKSLPHISKKLEELKRYRSDITRKIHQKIRELVESHRRLYRPVQKFVEQQEISSQDIPLSFQVSIIQEGFANSFFEKINRGARGTFSGIEESEKFIQSTVNSIDFNDENSVIEFVDHIHDCLHKDMREGALTSSVRATDQLKSGVKLEDVYDYLYSLSFLIPRYKLQFGNSELYQLSPGQRGLLLLVFYLMIDNSDIPLVIDQPEENLDNQTIYNVLVHCLTKAKNHRQVIVVTHNPNLAVVCDAEQVIYAHLDTATYTIEYESGAIENPKINKRVIDVLEGTKPAFDNRGLKYLV